MNQTQDTFIRPFSTQTAWHTRQTSVAEVFNVTSASIKLDDSQNFAYQSAHKEVRVGPTPRKTRPNTAKTCTTRASSNYSEAKPLVNSFREKKKVIAKSEFVRQGEEQQAKIKNELMLSNQHHLLRTYKDDVKNYGIHVHDSLIEQGHKRLSNNLKQQRAQSAGKSGPRHEEAEGNMLLRHNIMNSKVAEQRAAEIYTRKWMATRNGTEFEDKQKAIKFAKCLFESIDFDMSETLEGKELVQSLLSLGLAASSKAITKTIQSIFQQKVDNISIGFDEFVQLFKGDKQSNFFLSVLNQHIIDKRIADAIEEKMKESKSKISWGHSIFSGKLSGKIQGGLHFGPKHTAEKASSVKNSKSQKQKRKDIDLKIDKEGIAAKQVTIAEQNDTVLKWWDDIDENRFGQVNVNVAAEKLIQLKFSSELTKARWIIINNNRGHPTVAKEEFEHIFANCIFMSSLKNLGARLGNDKDPLESVLPPGVKVAAYRRNLIMSGLKYHGAQYTQQEGEQVIKAIRNYRIDTGNAIPEEELDEKSFRKDLSMLLLGIEKPELYDNIQFRRDMEEAQYKQQEEKIGKLQRYNSKTLEEQEDINSVNDVEIIKYKDVRHLELEYTRELERTAAIEEELAQIERNNVRANTFNEVLGEYCWTQRPKTEASKYTITQVSPKKESISPTKSGRSSKFGFVSRGSRISQTTVGKMHAWDFRQIPEREDTFDDEDLPESPQLTRFASRHVRGFSHSIRKAAESLKLSTEYLSERKKKAKNKQDRQEAQRDIYDGYKNLINHDPDAKSKGSGMMSIHDSNMFLKSFVK